MNDTPDYTNPLVKKYDGMNVRCFLNNGKVLIGMANFNNNFLYIDGGNGNSSVVNLDYVVAISAKEVDNGERQF